MKMGIRAGVAQEYSMAPMYVKNVRCTPVYLHLQPLKKE